MTAPPVAPPSTPAPVKGTPAWLTPVIAGVLGLAGIGAVTTLLVTGHIDTASGTALFGTLVGGGVHAAGVAVGNSSG